jgi:hypothetical protein
LDLKGPHYNSDEGEQSQQAFSSWKQQKCSREKRAERVGIAYPNLGKRLEGDAKLASLFLLHFPAATLEGTVATFSDNHLRATFAAEVHFPDLIGHESLLLF